jgi:DNA repair exonuclease SbcCD ATPase subunit
LEALRAKAADADASVFGRAKRLLEVDVAADVRNELAHFERRLGEIDSALSELHEHEQRAKHEAAAAAWHAALPEVVQRRREVEQAAQALVAALEATDNALRAAARAGAAGVAPVSTTFAARDAARSAAALAEFEAQTDAWLAATPAGEHKVEARLLSDRAGVGSRGEVVRLTAREALGLASVGVAEIAKGERQRWRESAGGKGPGGAG